MKRLAWLALLAAVLPVAGLGLSRHSRQVWRPITAFRKNTVHAILQTHDGYLWLATEGGLVRFDGLTFLVHDAQNTQELKSNSIACLLEDHEHTLWIGTADGLVRFSDGRFVAFTTKDGLPGNGIWSLYQDTAGKLWVVTSDGVAFYGGGRFQREPGTGEVNVMVQDAAGSLWAGGPDGLKRLRGAGESVATGRVQALLADGAGAVWAGTPNGLLYLKDGRIERTYRDKTGCRVTVSRRYHRIDRAACGSARTAV